MRLLRRAQRFGPTAIHFFDIKGASPKISIHKGLVPPSFSPNTLRTRLSLNFKGIPYTDSFVSYADIELLWRELRIPVDRVDRKGVPSCTLPVILLNNHDFGYDILRRLVEAEIPVKEPVETRIGTYTPITTTLGIAMALDMLYPQPNYPLLFPHIQAVQQAQQVQSVVTRLLPSARRLIIPSVPSILDERGGEYFTLSRQEWFGVSNLEELRPKSAAESDEIWREVEKELEPVIRILTSSSQMRGMQTEDGGRFLDGGPTPKYADIMMMAFLRWFSMVDEEAWDRLTDMGGGLLKDLWIGCLPLLRHKVAMTTPWPFKTETERTSRARRQADEWRE